MPKQNPLTYYQDHFHMYCFVLNILIKDFDKLALKFKNRSKAFNRRFVGYELVRMTPNAVVLGLNIISKLYFSFTFIIN